ncbi:hypothetical protein P7C73_g5851, partial [Tremellales sp. Uapishka_1]
MLYIASVSPSPKVEVPSGSVPELTIIQALTPTPVLHTLLIPSLTSEGSSSLVVAKPDRIEVWDTTPSGLEWRAEMEVWGSVVGLERVVISGAQPHILVLLSPPNAQLLLLAFNDSPAPSLIATSSITLSPPTPSLRLAEFFTSVITQNNTALVSLWIGVLSCVEMEIEKDKDAKKRRASTAVMEVEGERKRLKFRDNFNINPYPSKATKDSPDADYNDIPFSCPAARTILPIPGTRYLLVIGDEYCVLYSLTFVPQSPRSPLALSAGPTTSPRASATRRSPQNDMTGGPGKKRKSSISSKGISAETEEKWEFKPVWRVRQGFGTVLAATVIESHASGASVLIGDECGRLTAVGWEFAPSSGIASGSVRVKKVSMGMASPPSSMTYIDSAYLFLSSACGDSLLLSLSLPPPSLKRSRPSSPISPSVISTAQAIPGRKGKGKARDKSEGDWSVVLEDEEGKGSVEVKERWMNLAPVKDFCVIEEEGGGVSHLIVASGASNSNSLRVVRSGVGLEETVSIEGIEGAERMWGLPSSDSRTSTLLLSTSTSTLILRLGDNISQLEASPTLTSAPTLACSLVEAADGSNLVQITENGLNVWSDVVAGLIAASWTVETRKDIVAAQISGNLAAVALSGGEAVILEISGAGVKELSKLAVPAGEISSIAIVHSPHPYVAIGTWTNQILLFDLDRASTEADASLVVHESCFAASLIFTASAATTEASLPQLLAGLSDGSLLIYDLEPKEGVPGVHSRKVSSLGTRPLQLAQIHDLFCGEDRVLAIALSERMSIVFESKERDIVAATSISTPALGNCLVLATPTGLSFAKINSLKKLHVQTLDLGEKSANRLVSFPEKKVLGMGIISRTMDERDGHVDQKGSFELRDSITLDVLAKLELQEREEVTCANLVFLLGRSYLAVGTALFPTDDEFDDANYGDGVAAANSGRLLLLDSNYDDASDTWTIETTAIIKTVGPVHDAKVIHGFLAVASASKVAIHSLKLRPIPSLSEVASWSSAFIALHLSITPKSGSHTEDRLVVGDGMRSIFVLTVDEGSGQIYVDQRDMATHSVVALGGVQDQGPGVIIADIHSNLLTFRLKGELETAASFGLHEDVARFRHGAQNQLDYGQTLLTRSARVGSFVPASSASEVITPELLFATMDGRLGVIGELTTGATKTLDDLQRNLDKYLKGPGGIGWKSYRCGGTEVIKKETAGFIDGDFIQKFRDSDLVGKAEVEKILNGATTHERVKGLDGPADRGEVNRLLEVAGGVH